MHYFRPRIPPSPVATGLLILVLAAPSHADEREAAGLAGLAAEIDFLIQQAHDSRRVSTSYPNGRLRFRYEDLISDLKTVKQGLADYIGADLRDGRPIAPLDGRYR